MQEHPRWYGHIIKIMERIVEVRKIGKRKRGRSRRTSLERIEELDKKKEIPWYK